MRFRHDGINWECYYRFSWLKAKLREHDDEALTILDVGGATGADDLRVFMSGLSGQQWTTLDINESADITADASQIPLPDLAFDIVVCLDMLEHVSSAQRLQVLSELIRVARQKVYLVYPHFSQANESVEEYVCSYRLDDIFLKEHIENTLVNNTEVVDFLSLVSSNGLISDFNLSYIDPTLPWGLTMLAGYVNPSSAYKILSDKCSPDSYKRTCIDISIMQR